MVTTQQPDLDRWVRQFRERLERALGASIQLVLFGSYARGEATEGSDVDLLVIVPTLNKKALDTILEIAWEVGFEAGTVFSVIPVAEEELKSLAESPFLQTVQREGVRL
jgi:predicted nucleotidyltransferase